MKKIIIFLILIIAIGSVFRLWQINEIPPGIYPDEAINANQGWEASKTGEYQVFYPENHGREGLFINLIGLSFSIFGTSIVSFKAVSIFFGILTVLGMFLLTNEILIPIVSEKERRFTALLSSFLLATSFWHINFSRIGFRAIMLPFVLTFSFYFLFKGLRKKSKTSFILGGIIYGIGFHTYISFRLSVLLLAVMILSWMYIYFKKKELKKFFSLGLYFVIPAIIVALPIGIYFLQNPQDFISRAAPISVFAQESPVKAFIISLVKHLAMFNIYGDPNWRHNFATCPMLPISLGVTFLIGIGFSIKKMFSLIKNKSLISANSLLLLIIWFFVMLLPGVLTYEGLPHALRVIGVIPVIYIFTSIGFWHLYRIIKENFNKAIPIILILVILLSSASFEINRYFFDWGKREETKSAFNQSFMETGIFLNNLPEKAKKYVIKNEGELPAETAIFIQRCAQKGEKTLYIQPDRINEIKKGPEETIIVFMRKDENLLNKTKILFPQGEFKEENNIYTYIIK
jgi:hypothetical protein